MSNASKMGRIDRRQKTPGVEVFSSAGFSRVYGSLKMTEIEKWSFEAAAFRTAYRKTEGRDKDFLESGKSALLQHCGKSFGEGAANQVLARLGVFLMEAERQGVL